ncbi:related to histone acetyltransferase Spt10 [Lecanosticta acicola]|uniref:Related to histone acetyltransferase Spt10 n=1 Tax=Lecanosticta acicola TaxID=111012 RepID=A0AAI9EB65_9PEZI|nr:related to histone acetyltransferase Spt10 [Lecanosticta acicola]
MSAMLDDPNAPPMYRTSGQTPYPEQYGDLPPEVAPKQVTLRDRVTIATLVPFSSPLQVPARLMAYLCEMLNREIEKGDTLPMTETMGLSHFGNYWFSNFGAIMIMGDIQSTEEVAQMEARSVEWSKECLGSFFIKPNYPGRSSHVCNGSFLVTDAARNRGVGRLMGEGYLRWAPKLGYTYSIFNLVYETNVASLRIWDALGFKRVGRVKGCGDLKSYPETLIDAIIFGRELGGDGDEYVTEERFEKIRFYLKTGTYPPGSDRAEKSRLRSAATHYKLVENTDGSGEWEKLMLKGKEVISDPHKQYEIAHDIHALSHGGINKTTAAIAEKYHWVRIKETVSAVIRNCVDCKDTTVSTLKSAPSYSSNRRGPAANSTAPSRTSRNTVTAAADPTQDTLGGASPTLEGQIEQEEHPPQQSQQQPAPTAAMAGVQYTSPEFGDLPVDPQIMNGISQWDAPQQEHMQLDNGEEDSQHNGEESTQDEVSTRLVDQLQASIRPFGYVPGKQGDTLQIASTAFDIAAAPQQALDLADFGL